MTLGINEIKNIIPHRFPMLLLDRVEDLNPGDTATAYKAVTYNEPFFQGHYPEKPVMPGVLIVEALAQTGSVAILSCEKYKDKLIFFGGISKARFRKQVEPGCILKLITKITKMKGPVGVGEGKAYVGDDLVAEGELTFFIK
ncbi:3-hydroxyacyl-ACP dehydratase FabZ [Anaerosporobacter sp.]|uniref:3-hydroxyacyl-ACP dehydratase FabZ n=1 Tax=Anaerosporobacter sp. TaxID=1872529 RepID=UPI00286F39EB|nr:3-hydroxyacyl-ACP dehydratase FabZ [Anaerosporobacter sp.]